MFKMKHKKNTLNLVKDSLLSSQKTMQDGIKYVADKGYELSKNANLNLIKDGMQSKQASGLLVATGVGLAIFGLIKLMKKI